MSDLIKSDAWDLYDPNWEKEFDFHAQEHQKCLDLDYDSMTEEELNANSAKMEEHSRGMKEAHIKQFRNAKEYANWMIATERQRAKIHNCIWLEPDLSQINTREEANAAYAVVNGSIEKQLLSRHGSLPLDETIFKPEKTRSSNLSIEYGFMIPVINKLAQTNAVLSVEQCEQNKRRVCFTHLDQQKRGLCSIYNQYEEAATLLYHSKLKNEGVKATDIEWYVYRGRTGHSSEAFDKVNMSFENNVFCKGDFERQNAVPKAIKLAEFNAEGDEMISLATTAPQKTNANEAKLKGNFFRRPLG